MRNVIICAVCSSTEHARVFSEGETDFLICQNCGLMFRERFPAMTELTAIYATHYQAGNIVSGRTEQESGEYALEAYCRFLQRRLLPAASISRVLDYGAGTGRLVELFRAAGIQADGIEVAPDARRYCLKNRGFDLFASSNLLPENAYEVVTMIEVIEHLPNLMSDLAAVRKTLRQGGVLFVTTPNRLGLRARMQKGYWREARKKFHLFLFDRASIEQMLLRAGFARVDWVRFSPLQNSGFPFWLYGRACQCLGVSGTLAVIARR